MQGRDTEGHFIKGPMTEEWKEKISAGQIARYQRDRASHVGEPTKKVCSRVDCELAGSWQRVPEDFPMRRRKLKSGEVIKYPAGECKKCNRKRADTWKAKFIEEHGLEAWLEKQREQNRRSIARHRKQVQRYNREYQRIQVALKTGRTVTPRKKYAHEVGGRLALVDAKPFVEWLNSLNGSRPTERTMGEKLSRAVRRATSGEVEKIHLEIIDEVAVLVDMPHIVRTLYGDIQ